MARDDFIIRIGGDTTIGGVISTGENFATAAARIGFHTFTFRTYPSEIKGGHAWFQVRISNRPVYSLGDGCDILIAFDQEAYELHSKDLNEGGVLIYDSDLVHPEPDGDTVRYGVPFQNIARHELEFVRGTNVLVLGVMAGLFGLPPTALEEMVKTRYKRRADLMEKNVQALRHGYEYTKKMQKEDKYWLGTADHMARLIMSGNDAITAGALHAGCRYFAGYPITPASDILETMAAQLPRFGGVCLQAEDEMAAIASVIGASYTGTKAMTATSGPGFSLMTELLGLSSMAEIPIVIVDAQRSGPSTGMPTKLEQSDLFQALYGGHGDFPRIVLAPASVQNCFRVSVLAFGLAEKYQCPVILLSDQSLSHRTETISAVDTDVFPVVDRIRPNGTNPEDYLRYKVTENGVSPMAVPGLDPHTYVAPGLEHDERGHPRLSPQVHEEMTAKRFRKLEEARKETDNAELCPRYGPDKADLGIIGWGATQGSIREAVDRALAEGLQVAAMHPRVLNPLPSGRLSEFVSSVRHVLVPEVNYQGQFAHHLAATLGIKPIRLNKIGGLPFTPGEIHGKIKEVLAHA
ncbi:MAG TPA: 2-oxoacid:acceptor oxidoreductase subunit alpha [Dehalococcoidia bacterium]|nr:2-oxoacid:acceptor oxidoreductase subunit alpha [Dehalococcoidia bacterium]